MKEIWKGIKSFILSENLDGSELNKAMEKYYDKLEKSKFSKINIEVQFYNLIAKIMQALEKMQTKKAKEIIRKRDLEKEVNSITTKLLKEGITKANLIRVFYFVAKILIETDVKLENHSKYNDIVLFKIHKNNVKNYLECIKYTIQISDIDILNLAWTNLDGLVNIIIKIWQDRNFIEKTEKILDYIRDFFRKIKSYNIQEWIDKRLVFIELKLGDIFNNNMVYSKAELMLLERFAHMNYNKGNTKEAIEYAKEYLALANKLPQNEDATKAKIAKICHYLGGLYTEFYYDKQGLILAEPFFEMALNKINKIEKSDTIITQKQKADSLYNLALNQMVYGKNIEALKYFKENLEIYRKIERDFAVLFTFNIADIICRLLLRFNTFLNKSEIKHLRKDLDELIKTPERFKLKINYITILRQYSIILRNDGRFFESLETINKAIKLFEFIDDNIREGYNAIELKSRIHDAKAETLTLLNRFYEAQIEYLEATNLISNNIMKNRDLHYLLKLNKNLATIYLQNNDFANARELFYTTKQLTRSEFEKNEIVYRKSYIDILNDSGRFHIIEGDYDNSMIELKEALKLSKLLEREIKAEIQRIDDKDKTISENMKINYLEIQGKIYGNLGLLCIEQNNDLEANKFLKKSYEIRSILFNQKPRFFYLSYIGAMNSYSLLLKKIGEINEAVKLLLDAKNKFKKYSGKNFEQFRNEEIILSTNLALLYYQISAPKKSLSQYLEAYNTLIKLHVSENILSLKAKIIWGYNILKEKFPDKIKSEKLESLNLVDTIKEIEELPIKERLQIKKDIEHLYLWNLQLEFNKRKEENKLLFRILFALKSENLLAYSDKEDLDSKREFNVDKVIQNISILSNEKQRLQEKLTQSQKLILDKNATPTEKSKLITRLNILHNECINYLNILYNEEYHLNSEKLVENVVNFLDENDDTMIYVIQATPANMFHICLSKERYWVITNNKKFLEKGRILINKMDQYSDIVDINGKEYIKIKQEIEDLSVELWNFIPEQIREMIEKKSKIFLVLCNESQHVPFELIGEKGKEIGLAKIVSRVFNFEYFFSKTKFKPVNLGKLKSLLIVDPLDDNKEKLPEALIECENIKKILKANNVTIKELIQENANKPNVIETFFVMNDLIHYSGHGDKRGIILSRDQRINPRFVNEYYFWFPNKPLIFLNACTSGATYYKGGGMFEGLIPSLLRKNAQTIIGSKNKIFDDSSRLFAEEFYKHLLTGATVGKALQKTRISNKETLDWSKYILFGNPDYRIEI
ncbi:MAG: CHAT domain-containing protein [Candidatus Heimdallarchaeota archaeon]